MNLLIALHAVFNSTVIILFLFQASQGLRIRRARKEGRFVQDAVKRHRTLGPIIAVMAVLGYLAGLSVVFLINGRILVFPPHFFVGSTIVVSVVTTFTISRIMGRDDVWRTRHFRLGIIIITLFLLQALIGFAILIRIFRG